MATTLQEIKEMIGAKNKAGPRISRFNTLRTNQKLQQKYIDLKYEIEIHAEFRKIKLPTARQIVDTFVAHLPLSTPVVKVVPFSDTNPYRDRAEKQREYFDALLQWNMRQTLNAVRDSAKDLGARGEAFIKVVWDENAIGAAVAGDDDKRKELMLERMPLKIMCREPMNCYPSADHIDCRPVSMLEQYTVIAEQVKRIWPNWKKTIADNRPVVIDEWWTAKEMAYFADGVPLLKDGIVDNTYGLVPYIHCYTGLGYRDGDNSPESLAVGLIQYSIDLLKQQCRYHAYLDKAIAFASIPIYDLPGTPDDYEEGGKKLVPKPGDVLYRGDREGEPPKIIWAANNIPAGIMQSIGLNDMMLGKVQPQVLRGEAPSGVEAGYPMALMIGEARLQYGIPLENLQVLWARAMELVRLLIRDVVKEDVPIWGEKSALTMNQDDCKGAYRVSVEFDATTPEAAMNRAVGLQRLRQGGSISLETELELNSMIKNARKEKIRIDAESLSRHPAIQRVTAVKAIRAKEGEEEAMAVAEAMAEGEAGAERKAASSGIPQGGETEAELPEDILAGAIGRRGKALRGQK